MNVTRLPGFHRREIGWGDPQRQPCKCCGLPDRFNFNVPDELWTMIVPVALRNHVICLSCFDDLAHKHQIEYAPALSILYFAGRPGHPRTENGLVPAFAIG